MRISLLVPIILSCLSVVPAWAFPPAPYYRIYGTVRNEQGRPLAAGEGNVILDGVYSGRGTASVSGGAITGVTILSSGSGYTSAPTVHFVGVNGSGSGATGLATLADGVVTGVMVTNTGSGYVAPVTVGFSGGGGTPTEIVRTITSPSSGTNYALAVPMESTANPTLNDLSAMRPFVPFTIRVMIDGVNHVPIQIAAAPSQFWQERIDSVNSPGINTQGSHWAVGLPADKLRLDLTLGVDSDGDGLPDSWEEDIVNSLGLDSIADVDPNGDSDGDGVSDGVEYLAGTYAFDPTDAFELQIVEVFKTGTAPDETTITHLQFLSIPGRTYKIKEWTGSGEPIPCKFSTEATATATELRSSLLASDVVNQDVYVPATGVRRRFFVLSVE